MKAEFSEGIAYLERWYPWRDKLMDEHYGQTYNSGWTANTLCPDELRTYNDYEHGRQQGDFTLVRHIEFYRFDLYQLEDAMKGNGECGWERVGKCNCYDWPGQVYSLEWTEQDEMRWLSGDTYPQTESCFREGKLVSHLEELYGYSVYNMWEHANDVVLVIEEGDNAPQKEVRAGESAPDAKRLAHETEAGGAHATSDAVAQTLQAFASAAGSLAGRSGAGLREHVPAD